MLLPVPLEYLLGLLLWIAALGGAFVVLLRARRRRRGISARLRLVNLGLSVWMGLALVTACEVGFAFFVDRSDAFNTTNIARRWTSLHIDGERNAMSFRDSREFEKSIPAGTRRLCFVGDSFTMGHGIVNMADRFSDRVAAELQSEHPGKYLVANIADLGLEVAQVEGRVGAILKEGYDVDLVIYVICLNDIEYYADRMSQPNSAATKQHEQRKTAKPFFLISETYFLNWMYFRVLQVADTQTRGYYNRLKDAYDSPAWEPFRSHLDQLNASCRAHNAELRIVVFPFLHNLGPDYPFLSAHAKIVEYCKQKNVRVLDLEPVLREHVGERLTVNAFDAHPNERAHAIAAEAIMKNLLADLTSDSQSPEAPK
ncbi:MAG: SGNH/GDSL hydrolase family protein [Planctomycetaceae bacterium]